MGKRMPDTMDTVADIVRAKGSRSALEAVREALSRADASASLNAFASIDEGMALQAAADVDRAAAASVPLRGLTLCVKDNIHVAGLSSTAGTPAFKDFVAPDTSPVISRLQEIGAVVLGKSNMHELAYGITSNNGWLGPVRNPLDQKCIAGGSSGGTAAAIAAGIVTAGIATDTGGSVRIPAALTGIAGFRPSVGTYSSDAILPVSTTRDTLGLMARSVQDIALLHSFIVDEPLIAPSVKAFRIGVPRRHFRENLDASVEQVFNETLARLEQSGAILIDADLPGVVEANTEASFAIVLWETSELLPEYLAKYLPGISVDHVADSIKSPDVEAVLRTALSGAVTQGAYDHAIAIARPALQEAFEQYFSAHRLDAILVPTTPVTARAIEGVDAGVWVNGNKCDTFQTYIRNVDPASTGGLPAISIPAGLTDETLAVGIELQALPGQDDSLLGIALWVESVLTRAR